jgi:signal-transduction protein with cAMP-binding, CBS, and nucleotidyltransferase domain
MRTTPALVSDLELHPVAFIPAAAPLREAAQLLADTAASSLLVNAEQIVEVTVDDIVQAFASGVDCDEPVASLDLHEPIVVDCDAVASDAVAAMVALRRTSIVVVKDNQPVGAISLASGIAVLLGGETWVGALRVALQMEGSSR